VSSKWRLWVTNC